MLSLQNNSAGEQLLLPTPLSSNLHQVNIHFYIILFRFVEVTMALIETVLNIKVPAKEIAAKVPHVRQD